MAWSWSLSSLTHSELNDYITVYNLVSYILTKHYILITLLPDHKPSLPLHCLQNKPLSMATYRYPDPSHIWDLLEPSLIPYSLHTLKKYLWSAY